ncbi:hypothetical protein X975_18640, partial [Stegodyphus mimosarum]
MRISCYACIIPNIISVCRAYSKNRKVCLVKKRNIWQAFNIF